MMIKFKTLTPGSMIVSKRYNIFRRLWSKLRKKELPYNCITLFTDDTSIIDIYNNKSDEVLMQLKHNYNKRELHLLTKLAEEYTNSKDIYSITFRNKTMLTELFNILNTVRSNSINGDIETEEFFRKTNDKVRSNYYVKRLADEKDWDICIY